MQLNYGRAFLSAITFNNRYIYVLGGSTNTDCFEIIDTHHEHTEPKCELVLLNLDTYQPWFKEMVLPLNEEGIITFCGERYHHHSDDFALCSRASSHSSQQLNIPQTAADNEELMSDNAEEEEDENNHCEYDEEEEECEDEEEEEIQEE